MHIRKQSAIPESLEDLGRGTRPFDAKEADALVRVPATNDAGFTMARMRLRIIRLVDEDQNAVRPVVKILGPATGEDSVYIPCDGQVELSHIDELFEAAKRRREERARLRAQFLPERQDAYRRQLVDLALDNIERKKARSTFGYGGHLLREAL